MLTASLDGTANLWNMTSSNLLQTFSGHNAGVASAVFSRDGALLLTTSYNQTAKVWDADTGECIKTFKAGTITAVFACGDYGHLYGDYFAGGMWTGIGRAGGPGAIKQLPCALSRRPGVQ